MSVWPSGGKGKRTRASALLMTLMPPPCRVGFPASDQRRGSPCRNDPGRWAELATVRRLGGAGRGDRLELPARGIAAIIGPSHEQRRISSEMRSKALGSPIGAWYW